MALSHSYTASIVAEHFLCNIFKLHSNLRSIVSDRDSVFISHFWFEFFRLQQTQLNLNTTYHPQLDGQTEIVNQVLEGYLCCFIGEKPRDWSKWLALAKYW